MLYSLYSPFSQPPDDVCEHDHALTSYVASNLQVDNDPADSKAPKTGAAGGRGGRGGRGIAAAAAAGPSQATPARRSGAAIPEFLADRFGPDAIVSFSGKTYGFLSNYYTRPLMMPDSALYASAEHAFQARKAACAHDHDKIQAARTPSMAKKMGRKVAFKDGWHKELRNEVMRAVLAAKFAPGTDLAQKLLATGQRPLVEGNTWDDVYWGVTTKASGGFEAGAGENMLGTMLMETRANLAAPGSGVGGAAGGGAARG